MADYIIIGLAALLGSCLTFFSGFGLGTILVPVFALFFPVEISIALTAIVHFLNNLFKLFLVGKQFDRETVIRFGVPSLLASFAGAFLLSFISGVNPLFTYNLNDHIFFITPLKLIIGGILIFFALFDTVPKLAALQFDKKYIIAGGLLSGFFGGLSGNQGALRSAFLVKAGLSKETFIATGVVIAVLVDISRLTVYSGKIVANHELNYKLLACSTLCAFAGTYFGSRLIKKITLKSLQYSVGVALIAFGISLSLGWI